MERRLHPGVKWALVGVSFVVTFVMARMYVQEQLSAPPPDRSRSVNQPRQARTPPAPMDLSALELPAAPTPEQIEAAHAFLDGLPSRGLPDEALRAHQEGLLGKGHSALAAHVLYTRAQAAIASGAHDSPLHREALAWQERAPEDFAWLPVTTSSPDCPEGGCIEGAGEGSRSSDDP